MIDGTSSDDATVIRRGEDADAAPIATFTRRLAAEDTTLAASDEAAHTLDQALAPAQVRRTMHGTVRYFVAERGGSLVGVVATRDDRHLLLLFVAREARQRGLARALWARARDACIAAGHSGPYTVSAAPGAVPIYARLGFAPEGPATTEGGLTRVPMTTADQPSA